MPPDGNHALNNGLVSEKISLYLCANHFYVVLQSDYCDCKHFLVEEFSNCSIIVGVQGVELDDFVSGPRELLLKLVEEHYPLPQDPKHAEGLHQFLASKQKFL